MSGVYRARTIKRSRRTRAQIETLDGQVMGVLTHDHPQSVRHVYYRMTNPRLAEPVDKTERGYRHVQDRTAKLRRRGRLPYGWITDATRRGYFVSTFHGEADFLRRMKHNYRADLWAESSVYCEVWTESRSIAGVIQGDCEELAVNLYPAGGFSSITLAFEAAQEINRTAHGRRVMIFYIGDYDPAGVLIDVALERELRAHLRPGIDLTFERLGITAEQIAEYDLPTKPRKESDKRAQHVETTVEAEAMPAGILRQLLRSRIEELLPARALEIAQIEEESARDYLGRLADIIERGSGGDE
jgi:hypothetical protein